MKITKFHSLTVLGIAVCSLTLALFGCANSSGKESEPSGPAGVPVAPNRSLITAKLISITKTNDVTFVEIEVLASEPIAGSLDMGANVVGKQITAQWIDDGGDLSPLIDHIISAKLRYEGDEGSGTYLISEVSEK